MADLVRDPLEELRPELDYLRTVCAGLSLPDPVEAHLEPLVGGWAEMTAAAADWSSTAATLDSLADDASRADSEPVAVAVARAHRDTAASLRTASQDLERTSADAARLVADAAELLADVGRTASAVLTLPALGADAARRIVVEADERVRVCAESVAELVAAVLQQWQALTTTLQADPLLGQVQQQQAAPQQEQLHAGGISVVASTSGGAHVEVTALEPAAPTPQPPAEPAAVAEASAAPEPVAAGTGGAGGSAAGGVSGAGSGGSSGGGGAGAAGGGTAAPAAAPLSGGSRVAAVEEGPGARPAAAAAPAAASAATAAAGGSTGGGMMGMGGAGAGGGGGDTERKRTTRYVADPEEVFGTPQKTAPPVIGERSP